MSIKHKIHSVSANWRYHNALRMCQVGGIRLGTESNWTYYLIDGDMWRFRHGRVVGPLQFNRERYLGFVRRDSLRTSSICKYPRP